MSKKVFPDFVEFIREFRI